nr:DNA helicase [Tanacetum cinerariifolium]
NTFLWKTIIYAIRSQGKIIEAVASSCIASLLLPAGSWYRPAVILTKHLKIPALLPQVVAPTTMTAEQPQQLPLPKPPNPTLSTTTSNQPEVIEGNTSESQERQSTQRR